MRRLHRVLFPVAVATSLLIGPTAAYASHGVDLDCSDFRYRQDAQAHMGRHPGDPDRLDESDNDGLTC